MNTDDLLHRAVVAFKKGEFLRVEQICSKILRKQPGNAVANHLLGIIAFNSGKCDFAERHITAAIRNKPEYAEAYSNYGVLLTALGRIKEAVIACGRAIQINPSVAAYHYNLGNACCAGAMLQEALISYDRAVYLDPSYAEAYVNRGNVLKDLGDHARAMDDYDLAIKLNPQMAEAYNNRANILRNLGRLSDALQSCERAIEVRSSYAEAHHNRGSILKEMGRMDEACESFKKALGYDPDMVSSKYLLASLGMEAVPTKSPGDYIVQLFDGFADGFDDVLLGKLSYHVPQLLFEVTKGWIDALPDKPDLLDLGCGTGLCGVQFYKYTKKLVGVDLSSRMLEKASARGIYTNLIQSDICDALKSASERFDLVLSADLFIYFGDLDEVFGLVCSILKPSGMFSFSIENSDGDSDYMLRETGRYAHSSAYICRLMKEYGFEEVSHKQVTLRYDKHVPVSGSIYMLQSQL